MDNEMWPMIRAAALLLSEDEENPEYDRGVSELTAELLRFPLTAAPDVLAFLRRVKYEHRERGVR